MDTLLQFALANALSAMVAALVAAGVGVVCRRPALMHWLWLFVLFRLLAPPLFPLDLPGITEEETVTRLPTVALTHQPAREEEKKVQTVVVPLFEKGVRGISPSLVTVVVALWVTGSAAFLVRTIFVLRQFRRLFRLAHPAPTTMVGDARDIAERFGLRAAPPIWLVPGTLPPLVALKGGRPIILLPCALWGTLSNEARNTILAHELAHIRRGDPWVRLLEWLTVLLYWWHPVVFWARRRIRSAEDECCDAWVLWAKPGWQEIYAATLLTTTRFLSGFNGPSPLLATEVGRLTRFKRRLKLILEATTPRRLSRMGALIAACLGALMLIFSPALGQSRADVLVQDSFSGETLDTDHWEVLRSRVTQKQRHVALHNRGYLVTKREYPQPISLSFRWRWVDHGKDPLYKDSLVVALRTSGRPKPVHAYEVSDGIGVRFDATAGIISIDTMPEIRILERCSNESVHIPPGVWHEIRITDDGETIAVFFRGGHGGQARKGWQMLKVQVAKQSRHHRIALYNREFVGGVVHESHVSAFVLRRLTERSRGK